MKTGTSIHNEFTAKPEDAKKLLLGKDRFILMAFDPGLTTGCAVYEVDPYGDMVLLETCEYGWSSRMMMTEELLGRFQPKIVVIETYRLFAEKAAGQIGSTIAAVEIKGMIIMAYYITYGRYNNGEVPIIVLQNPGEENGVAIRRQDMRMMQGVSEHRKDAYKHGRLLYERLKRLALKQ